MRLLAGKSEPAIFIKKLTQINATIFDRVTRIRVFATKNPVTAFFLLLTGTLIGLPLFALLTFLSLLYAGAFGKLPATAALHNINHNIASEVYAADGVLLGRYFIENRLPTTLEEVAPHVIDALVATEDARFYQHNGIDYRAWARVIVRTILLQDESSGGGSTLSQQLAKNLFPRKKYWILNTPINKAREIAIALRLEKVYSKEELLTLYLNKMPFSDNVFGIKVASQRFFNTTPDKLKVEEAALLIGQLQATTAYHPIKKPQRALQRRNVVLTRMVSHGYLDPAVADSLKELPVQLTYSVKKHDDGIGTYFREYLRLQLEEALKKQTKEDGSAYNLYTDGLKIYTTLDSKMQLFAEKAVAEEMKTIQAAYYKHFKNHKDVVPYGNEQVLIQQVKASERYRRLKEKKSDKKTIDSIFAVPVKMTVFSWKDQTEKDTTMSPLDSIKYYLSLLNTGFLAVEPVTGAIKAWVGGVNFKNLKFDHVKSRRQVGSTFKPVVYAQALQSGIKPCKRFHNEHITYEEFEGWAPRNVDNKYGGWYNMEGALKKSINTIAVQVILEIGVDSVRQMAKRMGVNSPIPKEAGIALGGVDLTLFEMVNVFATLANRGVKPELHCIARIETADGKVLKTFSAPNPEKFGRALSQQHADMLTKILTKVVKSGGTASKLQKLYEHDAPVAGKTGTSNNNRDGWFIGYTPDIVIGAWVGGDNQWVRFHDTGLGQGSSTALPVCVNFLNQLYENKAFETWEEHEFPELDSLTNALLDCHKKAKVDSTLLDSLPLAPEPILPENEEIIQTPGG
jgi:penicillin-binding protein 1A